MANLSEDPLRLYALFPFDIDTAYQKGLESILTCSAGHPDASSKDDIELHARVFYFNRVTGHSVTVEQAREVEATRAPNEMTTEEASPSVSASEAPHPPPQRENHFVEEQTILSFTELQELIASGRVDEIPNNKIIPNALHDASPSVSAAPVRKKPWECATAITKVEEA